MLRKARLSELKIGDVFSYFRRYGRKSRECTCTIIGIENNKDDRIYTVQVHGDGQATFPSSKEVFYHMGPVDVSNQIPVKPSRGHDDYLQQYL